MSPALTGGFCIPLSHLWLQGSPKIVGSTVIKGIYKISIENRVSMLYGKLKNTETC